MTRHAVLPILAAPLLALALAAGPAASTPAPGPGAIERGREAPAFDLRTIDGDSVVSSRELFAAHPHVFLVFWSSGCPHCVEALRGAEAFHRRSGGTDIAVVGVNADDRSALDLRAILEGGSVTFTQLRDPGAAISDAYGAPFETLTLVHVAAGAVAGTWRNPDGDIGAALEEMLLEDAARSADAGAVDGRTASAGGKEDAPPGGAGPSEGGDRSGAGEKRLVFHARERMRVMIVDSRSPLAKGLYGENVKRGRTVLQRAEVEGTALVTEYLRAGALLRISNEDESVLESGPAYYGSEWGSAFAEVSIPRFSLRLGYYPIHMTPLTLMRWDWDDSPRIGGDAGCGCGPTAGSILFESLEELGPDLVFEGALAMASIPAGAAGDVETRAFYAMPRRPLETEIQVYMMGIEPRAEFSLELAGAEVLWQRLDRRTGSHFKASARVLTTFENRSSVDFGALGYSAAPQSTNTALLGFSCEIPVLPSLRLRGEIVPWNRQTYSHVSSLTGMNDDVSHSSAGTAGFVFEPSPRHLLQADYLRLDEGYSAPFAALSYRPNMRGYRVSGREWILPDLLSLSAFYRRLGEIELPQPYLSWEEKAHAGLFGASIDAGSPKEWAGGIGWLAQHDWRGEDRRFGESRRTAAVAYLSRGFESLGIVRLEYQRVGQRESILEDPYVDIWSLEASVRF